MPAGVKENPGIARMNSGLLDTLFQGIRLRSLAQKPRGSELTLGPTCSLYCSSFLGLPCRFLNIELDKQKRGTTMETVDKPSNTSRGNELRAIEPLPVSPESELHTPKFNYQKPVFFFGRFPRFSISGFPPRTYKKV